jgi:hypothetical protein
LRFQVDAAARFGQRSFLPGFSGELPVLQKAASLCSPPLARRRRSVLRMCLRIAVKESPDHALVLRSMLLCLALEEIDAVFGERNRDFDTFLSERKRLGTRQKIPNHF